MNRFCKDISIRSCNLVVNGDQFFTIKGGCQNIELNSLCLIGVPKVVDIDLGNYSEQSDLPPKNIWIKNCYRDDGKPLRIRLLNCSADEVHVIGDKVEVFKPWWVQIGFFDLYCWLRKKNIIK